MLKIIILLKYYVTLYYVTIALVIRSKYVSGPYVRSTRFGSISSVTMVLCCRQRQRQQRTPAYCVRHYYYISWLLVVRILACHHGYSLSGYSHPSIGARGAGRETGNKSASTKYQWQRFSAIQVHVYRKSDANAIFSEDRSPRRLKHPTHISANGQKQKWTQHKM